LTGSDHSDAGSAVKSERTPRARVATGADVSQAAMTIEAVIATVQRASWESHALIQHLLFRVVRRWSPTWDTRFAFARPEVPTYGWHGLAFFHVRRGAA
jgi:hypothetical protein